MSDPQRDPELDQLVSQLNAMARGEGTPPAREDEDEIPTLVTEKPAYPPPSATKAEWSLPDPTEEGRERLFALVQMARQQGATDVLFAAGAPPMIRVNGSLQPLVTAPLLPPEAERLCAALIPREGRAELGSHGSLDFGWSPPGLGRCRCNIHRQRGRWAASVRLFPMRTISLEDLNLPPEMARLTESRHGLILVTGPAGSGKTTTIAALLSLITAKRRAHVITIEDPIEIEIPQGISLVEQVEVGRDAPSFAAALRAALRQDPDVLVVGEMRDPETIAFALTAAETGHLVFSTLHTGDAGQAVSRIIDAHPASETAFVRSQLAASLNAVVTQHLIPRAKGSGRVPAVELLLFDDATRNLVRQGNTQHLIVQIAVSRAKGMRSLDLSLAELVKAGLIEEAEARARARNIKEFDLLLGK